MSVLSGALRMGRTQAEARMLDAGRGFGLTEGVDPDTLETIQVETVRYSGKFRIATRSTVSSDRDAAGQSFASQSLILSVPVGAPPLRTDDVWMVEAVDADTGDPATIGRRYRVAGQDSGSQATASRYPVELIS